MRKFHTLILSIVVAMTVISANAYTIYSVTGNVKISSSGKITPAAKGVVLKKSDLVSIPDGASISIMDEATRQIYTSKTRGNTSVENLILQSSKRASNNAEQVNSWLPFSARGSKGVTGSRVYREKGMVTRSQNLFDIEAANIEIDPDTLAQLVAHVVYFESISADTTLNFVSLPIDTAAADQQCGFELTNPLETPIYFNVLKILGVHNRQADISSLGQPGGFYILPPGHTMIRTRRDSIPDGEKHVLVACHYSFDIDALIESLNKIINDDELIIEDSNPNIPALIRVI